jgi:glycosyltransferase involved in cell wall biosynthesis
VIDLYKGACWHATSQEEAAEIYEIWGAHVPVVIARNLPAKSVTEIGLRRRPKQPHTLRLVFLSRISRKKNLHGAISILCGVKSGVYLDIYGAKEDAEYWDECSQLLGELPENVVAEYKGVVPLEDVIPTLSEYDAFLLPTLGENFGHVIFEALMAGCPVLLSNRTPWRNLADRKAGFDIELNQPSEFHRAIEQLAAMSPDEFESWSKGARTLGLEYSGNPELIEQTCNMLKRAISV